MGYGDIGTAPYRAAVSHLHLGGGAIMKRKPLALRNIGRDARALADYEVGLVHGCERRFAAAFEARDSAIRRT